MGLHSPIVSVGSTPTAICAERLDGISELRAGVYVFWDLFQTGLGVCQLNDIALSVLTTVLAHKKSHNRLIVDAGGLALSKDRGTAGQTADCGYGLVCDQHGQLLAGLKVNGANQEHGIIQLSAGRSMDEFPVGSRLRILPNHACMTAAAHDKYFVVENGSEVVDCWHRCGGW